MHLTPPKQNIKNAFYIVILRESITVTKPEIYFYCFVKVSFISNKSPEV